MNLGESPTFLDRVRDFYARYAEESRLTSRRSRLEFVRTCEILDRVLPAPPARVTDAGGGAGAYAFRLAERGYEVHLVDLSPRLVDEARRRDATASHRLASASVGDARELARHSGTADAVLLLGPLYHLTARAERFAALREAQRVLAPGGVVVAASISRYASALDGTLSRFNLDPRFIAIRDRDLADGQHRNDENIEHYFTTAYFHRPEDLEAELSTVGFDDVRLFGVEGPGWLMPDFDERWADDVLRNDLLDLARRLESERSIIGASAHVLGVGRR